ncbi:MAG: hypothetical protein U0797_09755 [Gemmataceae bacterium]
MTVGTGARRRAGDRRRRCWPSWPAPPPGPRPAACSGRLLGLGVPENDAEFYQNAFAGGHALVSVSAGDRAGEAAAILERHGALTHVRRAAPA